MAEMTFDDFLVQRERAAGAYVRGDGAGVDAIVTHEGAATFHGPGGDTVAGAPDVASYWRNIVSGANSITPVPAERWNVALHYDANGTGDKTPSRWGGFIPDVAFDPAAHGIPPRSVAAIDPVQLVALEVAQRALEDAGYAQRELDRSRASVIFGAEAGSDLSNAYLFRGSMEENWTFFVMADAFRLPRTK